MYVYIYINTHIRTWTHTVTLMGRLACGSDSEVIYVAGSRAWNDTNTSCFGGQMRETHTEQRGDWSAAVCFCLFSLFAYFTFLFKLIRTLLILRVWKSEVVTLIPNGHETLERKITDYWAKRDEVFL